MGKSTRQENGVWNVVARGESGIALFRLFLPHLKEICSACDDVFPGNLPGPPSPAAVVSPAATVRHPCLPATVRHQSIRLNDEVVLVRKALVLIVLCLVIAVLVRHLAGPL